MLTRAGSEMRHERFRAMLARRGLDAAVVSDPRDIYYLTGLLIPSFPGFPALLYVEADGGSWLAAPTADGEALADDRVTYETNVLSTLNPDPMRRLAQTVAGHLTGKRAPRRLGWQAEALPRLIGEQLADTLRPGDWVAIDDDLAALEKRKDADEVALLRQAIDCSRAAYDAARAAIAPGVTELAVLEAAHTAATLHAGEIIFHSGDYRSGERGGPARDRAIRGDELYIIDAWSTYHGYWSDLCRTFAVSEPTPLQREVFDHLAGILEVGDVVSCEPGAYTPALNAGVRLENTFLITESGAELLSDYPVSLT